MISSDGYLKGGGIVAKPSQDTHMPIAQKPWTAGQGTHFDIGQPGNAGPKPGGRPVMEKPILIDQPGGPVPKPGSGPVAPRPGAPGPYSGQSTIKPPQYIDIEDTEASVNNTLARGQQAADQRYQVKQMDRAGMSRGKGQQSAAQIQSAKEMTSAANQAAETRAQDQMTNEKMRADYEKAREQEALAIAGAQFGMNFAGMQAQLAQQRAAAGLMFSLMR